MHIYFGSHPCVGEFILNDRVLQQLPNVVLSLHLLMEACNQDSFWKPYIGVCVCVCVCVCVFVGSIN